MDIGAPRKVLIACTPYQKHVNKLLQTRSNLSNELLQGVNFLQSHWKCMESLLTSLDAYLSEDLSLNELSSVLSQSLQEIDSHRSDIASMLSSIPDFLVSSERNQWQSAYNELEKTLSDAEKNLRDSDFLRATHQDIEKHWVELVSQSLCVREAAWAARGPSSHPGANEILHIIEQILEEPNEILYELLSARLEVEASRFEHQAESYQELPEFIALAMEELLPEFRDLLEQLFSVPDLASDEIEPLYLALEQWALKFSLYDLDFLTKRYSQVPTTIPTLNFALNCKMLHFDQLVNDEMVDHAAEFALETLQNASSAFLENQTLNAVDQDVFMERQKALSEEIEVIPEATSREELKELGEEIARLSEELISAQDAAETNSGSRLDFKSEL